MARFVRVKDNLIINIEDVIAIQRREDRIIDVIFKYNINGRITESDYYTIEYASPRRCGIMFNKLCSMLIELTDGVEIAKPK